jgi:hypothetical protein
MPLHCCKRWGVTPGAVQLLGEDEEPLGFDQIEGTPLTDPEVYQLTPLYDVLSFWPVAGGAANNIQTHKAKMAMAGARAAITTFVKSSVDITTRWLRSVAWVRM